MSVSSIFGGGKGVGMIALGVSTTTFSTTGSGAGTGAGTGAWTGTGT